MKVTSDAPPVWLHSKPRRRELLLLAVVLLAGLALRALYLGELLDDPTFSNPAFDADYHDYWAWGMASGDWSRPMGLEDPRIPETPYFRPPAYPYVLAAVYGVVGHDYLAPRLLQFGLGLVSCVLAWWLGRGRFGPGVGIVFAALMACYWVFIFFEGELLAPALLVFLALGLVLCLSSVIERPSLWRGVVAGVLAGSFALARPNILLFIPIALVWLAWLARRRGEPWRYVRVAVGFAVAAGLTILPAAVRNRAVAGEWILITANSGINLYIGNNPDADGTSPAIPEVAELTGRIGWTCFDYPNLVRGLEERLGRRLSYSEANRYWTARALDYIRRNPREFARLTARRVALFWGPREVGNNRDIHFARLGSPVLRSIPINFPLVFALALTGAGLWCAHRRRGDSEPPLEFPVLVLLFVLVYAASFAPFFFAARYRVPVIPFLLLFGAYAVCRFIALLRSRDFRKATAVAMAGAVLFAAASANLAGYESREDEWHFTLGTAYEQQGRTELAIDEYRRALRLNPRHSVAHNNLGTALIKQGRTDEGVDHLERALRLNPGDPNAHFNVGAILLRTGRPAEAAAHYRQGLQGSPSDPHAHVNLGGALLELGRASEALEHFREARRLLPDLAQAHLNEGRALLELERVDEAIGALRTAAGLRPDSAWTRLYLGRALELGGRPDEAVREYRKALELRPGMGEAAARLDTLTTTGVRP